MAEKRFEMKKNSCLVMVPKEKIPSYEAQGFVKTGDEWVDPIETAKPEPKKPAKSKPSA